MKSILISIKPKECSNILNYLQTIIIKKTMPKCDLPIDVYIYCTKNGHEELPFEEHALYKTYYCGKVVAKFTLNKVEEIRYFDELQISDGYEDYDGNWVDTSDYAKDIHWVTNGQLEQMRLSYDELHKYLGSKNGYAWHISNLEIFDKQKNLSEFRHRKQFMPSGYMIDPLTKAPQSWCYVEE